MLPVDAAARLDGVVLNRCFDIGLLSCDGSISVLLNISGGDACGGVDGKACA